MGHTKHVYGSNITWAFLFCYLWSSYQYVEQCLVHSGCSKNWLRKQINEGVDEFTRTLILAIIRESQNDWWRHFPNVGHGAFIVKRYHGVKDSLTQFRKNFTSACLGGDVKIVLWGTALILAVPIEQDLAWISAGGTAGLWITAPAMCVACWADRKRKWPDDYNCK